MGGVEALARAQGEGRRAICVGVGPHRCRVFPVANGRLTLRRSRAPEARGREIIRGVVAPQLVGRAVSPGLHILMCMPHTQVATRWGLLYRTRARATCAQLMPEP